ncbi:MAG: hypothetical protein AAFS13_07510 [Pseudomonadota bacterium]
MILTRFTAQSAPSSLTWLQAYVAEPELSGLPKRKGFRRPEDTTRFVLPIRQSFIEDARLMPGTTRMLCLLAGWSGHGGPIHTTLATIGKHLGRSVRQVQRYIKDAAEEGYLVYGYRKGRLGYITGLRIRLNPAAIFAPKRALPKPRPRTNSSEAQGIQAATDPADTNGKIHIQKTGDRSYDQKLIALCDRNGLDYVYS